MKFCFTFPKGDKKLYGGAFEMAVKTALHRKNADFVSPVGRSDFMYKKHYDVKQNGSPICYGASYNPQYIRGSSRVIYATHIAYEIVSETETEVTIFVNLSATDRFCVDRRDFLDYLLTTPGMIKECKERDQINIQSLFNYKKNAYHGAKGKRFEQWLDKNKLTDDTIVEDILDGFYSLMEE